MAVFNGVFGNPTCSQVMDGAAAYKAHKADCIIGFGGGAALDVAKVVGVAATHEGDILEYVWDHPKCAPSRMNCPISWLCPPLREPARKWAAPVW